jgi:biopolymer transport protein ExbD
MFGRRRGLGLSRVDVPITPMLDMTFQLLFYFILIYNPSALEGEMDLTLPTPKDAVKAPDLPDKQVESPGDEPDNPPEVTVVVRTQHDGIHDGLISQVSVVTNAADKPVETPNGQLTQLVEQLTKVRETLSNKTDVKLVGDSRLKWESVVKVRDACQKAGFANASFAAPPDLGVSR